MKTKFIHNSLAVSEFGAVYSFKNQSNGNESATSVLVESKNKTGKVASWGKMNNEPNEIMKSVRKSGVLARGLKFRKELHYGNGLMLTKEIHEKGKKEFHAVPFSDAPEIKEFFRRNNMKRFLKEVISDEETFYIAFPEYILSKDFKKINRVYRQKAAWCRFEVMNEKTGFIENVYISSKWCDGFVNTDSDYVAKVPLIDAYWSAEEVREHCKKHRIKNFIRPIIYPVTDEAYYPIADWHSIIKNGWIDVASNVPAYKKALFENQISIKYIIEIDERYFEKLYAEDWEDFKPSEKQEKRREVIDAINDTLATSKNAGKSIQSMKFVDENGTPQSAVTVTDFTNKIKDGVYLPDATAANDEISFALGVDPTLIGAGIPGKNGSGGGSDKREAFTIASALCKSNRDNTLEIFEFIQDFNGWDQDLVPVFENTVLTTLDKNPTGAQSVTA